MSENDLNARVKEALDRTEFMVVGTVGEDGSWVCPVQFSYDEKLNLFFKSMPHTKHMQNIAGDSRVSVSIFKTERFADGEVLGLQIKGTAEILSERSDVEEAAKCHYGRDAGEVDYRTKIDEHMGTNVPWKFVKITPTEAWIFDSRTLGEERHAIPLQTLDIR